MNYFNTKTVSATKRQVYTGNKSVYTTVGSSYKAYLRPLSEEASASNNLQYGYGFNLIVEIGTDIKEGDRVTIDSIDYTVRGVVSHDRGGILSYKRALITKPEN